MVQPMCRDYTRLKKDNARVVVTGCDTGFGRQIALRFNELGAHVIAGVISSSSIDSLKASSLYSDRMEPVLLDVTKEADISRLASRLESEGVILEALVNNAGVSAFGWAEQLPVSRFAFNMDVNYLGTVRMTLAFLKHIRRAKGRIIMMGSVGAVMPSAFGSAYLSTKAAMVSFTECVRQEVFRFGVKVCLVMPGFFQTALLSEGASNGSAELKRTTEASEAGDYPAYSIKMEKTACAIRAVEALNGGTAGVNWVVDAVVDAAVNRFPDDCRYVGWDTLLVRAARALVPNFIVDAVQSVD